VKCEDDAHQTRRYSTAGIIKTLWLSFLNFFQNWSRGIFSFIIPWKSTV